MQTIFTNHSVKESYMTIYKNEFRLEPLCWKRKFGHSQPNLDIVVAIVYKKGRRPAIEMLQSEYKSKN